MAERIIGPAPLAPAGSSSSQQQCGDGAYDSSDEEEHDAVHEEEQAADKKEHEAGAASSSCTLFLSHSGKQKRFVEHLDMALRRTNHTPFFDQITLSRGSRFPPEIKRAARGCKLGVVVLSDDFVTTKWPMLELEMLLSKPDAQVFPLFYELSPADLKHPEKLSQWRSEWTKLAARYENLKTDSWEKLLQDLDSFNGEIYRAGTSEAAYIEKVVRHICDRVPSPAPYDLSHIQGHGRLAQEVARLFDHRRIVGLHGVGGLGKTTMCQIMVNFYNSKYPGRFCLIEFPTDGNKKDIVEECKRFLKQILHLSEEHLLNNIHTFDQVVPLMRKHLTKYDVFIAMDNIWPSSLEEAKRILQEFKNFGSGSKILLTSRSQSVVQDLLEPHGNACVESLPQLEHAEAIRIFEDAMGRDDVKPLIMSFLSKQCVFDMTFHPLALKAVGKYVKRVCEFEAEQNIELVMKDRIIKDVEDAVRINYDHLSDDKKHIFLDIVCVLPDLAHSELSYTELLSLLYKDSKSKTDIINLIRELALDGLIDTVKQDGAKKSQMIIRVHDLYDELGWKEAAKSSRFFVGGISSFKMEKIKWKRLERVILTGEKFDDEVQMFIAKLELQECPNLQVLCAGAHGINVNFAQGIHLDRMPSLCILQLDFGKVRRIENWVAAAESLAVIVLSHVHIEQILERIPRLPFLKVLRMQALPNLLGCTDQLGLAPSNGEFLILSALKSLQKLSLSSLMSLKSVHLSGLVQLESLEISDCRGLEEVTGLDALKSLQNLHLKLLTSLKSLHVSGLVQLESLKISDCHGLEEVTGLDALKSLRYLNLKFLSSLIKSLHGLSGLVQLESLEISNCSGLEEVTGLDALKSLQRLHLEQLRNLKSLHGLSGLVQLESLEISDCYGLEEVTGLDVLKSLQKLHVQGLESLKSLTGLSGLVQLESLEILFCRSLQVIGLDALKSLQKLHVQLCTVKLLGLKDLVELESLEISRCIRLEEVTGLDALKSLQKLHLEGLGSLKSLPGLSGLVQLESLEIAECDGLEEVTGLACGRLRSLKVAGCRRLKKVADFSALSCLRRLLLAHNQVLEEIGGHLSSTQLDIVCIKGCRKLPGFKDWPHVEVLHLTTLPDWSHLTSISKLTLHHLPHSGFLITPWPPLILTCSLKSLSLKYCESLQKVSDLGFFTSLIHLQVYKCKALEEIGDLSALKSLKQIELKSCSNLKRLVGLDQLSSAPLQIIRDCPRLKEREDYASESEDHVYCNSRSPFRIVYHSFQELEDSEDC